MEADALPGLSEAGQLDDDLHELELAVRRLEAAISRLLHAFEPTSRDVAKKIVRATSALT